MRSKSIWLAAFTLAPLGIVAALLFAEAARLPSASSLDVYLPAQRVTVSGQPCRDVAAPAVPAATLIPLEPALRAAEPERGRQASSIARSMLCGTPRGMLHFHLDEALLIGQIRLHFTPQEQRTIFLNRVYFGGDVPGVAAASERLFQHPPDQLTLPQRALLMGMIRNPRHFDPRHPPEALARRNAVLDQMLRNGDITAAQAETAKRTPLDHQFDHAG